MIEGVDRDADKRATAERLGTTDHVNPGEVEGDLVGHRVQGTGGGADHTFDATGSVGVMRAALEAAREGWGESIIVGVAPAGAEIAIRSFQLVTGRTWRGTAFGRAPHRRAVHGGQDRDRPTDHAQAVFGAYQRRLRADTDWGGHQEHVDILMATRKDAFQAAGYALANPRSDWSAIRGDRKAAITIWSDKIDKSGEPWVYDLRDQKIHPKQAGWSERPGHKVRTRHVREAIEAGHTCFDLILCVAEDTAIEPRKVKIARHWKEREGVIDPDTFDPHEGTFRMELRPVGT